MNKKAVFFSALLGLGALFYFKIIPSLNPAHLLSSFSSDSIQNKFMSYMTEVQGVSKLQVAELKQIERLTQESRKRVLWNKLELPKVVVALEVPVQYTYYVDLEKEWKFDFDGQVLKVKVPPLEFNAPAPDVSAMSFEVQKSSLFRNEAEVKQRLVGELTPFLVSRAEQQKILVEESGRNKIRETIKKWATSMLEKEISVEVEYQLSEDQPQPIY